MWPLSRMMLPILGRGSILGSCSKSGQQRDLGLGSLWEEEERVEEYGWEEGRGRKGGVWVGGGRKEREYGMGVEYERKAGGREGRKRGEYGLEEGGREGNMGGRREDGRGVCVGGERMGE
jgi:hypothetical protein